MSARIACLIVAVIVLPAAPAAQAAVTFDTTANAGTFVRQNAPGTSYGGLGAVSVSGSTAPNGLGQSAGVAETFLKFNMAAAAASFDAQFGAGNWTVSGVTLRLVETAAPIRTDIFGMGQGSFEVTHMANDAWADSGLVWNNKSTVLNPLADSSLGVFETLFQGDQRTPVQRFALAMDDALLADIMGGGAISLHLTPEDSTVGATFNGPYMIGTARPKPVLEVEAVPEPATLALLAAGAALLGRMRRISRTQA